MDKCARCGKEYKYQCKEVYNEDLDFVGCMHDGEFVSANPESAVLSGQRAKHSKDIVQPNNKEFDKLYPNTFD